ncbi:MAG: hypothetical protein ABEJ56_02660 [Candidatus Nanohaloarchaea archaeon]
MELQLAFALASIMAGVHFLVEEIESYTEGFKEEIISFGAGVSISYVFVQLLPEFHSIVSESSEMIFAFPLIGFSSLHLIEKYLAKSDVSGIQLRKDYADLHYSFLFFYHTAIGYLIASLLEESAVSGILFYVPILIHVAVSSFSLNELHESISKNLGLKISISLAPVLGVMFFSSGLVSDRLFNPVFGSVIGMFFYVAVRDSIPEGKKGKPLEYLLGVLIYLGIILAANLM